MNILLPNLAPLRVDHPPHFVEADNIGTKGAPTIVINGVIGPYKWPKMNGFSWGELSPQTIINGVISSHSLITADVAHLVQGIDKGTF